jgi:hypothetical protein
MLKNVLEKLNADAEHKKTETKHELSSKVNKENVTLSVEKKHNTQSSEQNKSVLSKREVPEDVLKKILE